MIDKAKIFGQCLAVAQSNFQEILYKDYSTVELYGINGVANRATRISHSDMSNRRKEVNNLAKYYQ